LSRSKLSPPPKKETVQQAPVESPATQSAVQQQDTAPALENRLPANFSTSIRFRQDSAMSVKGPVRLTANRTYAYFDMAYDFWTSASGKYQIRFSASARGFYDSVFGLTRLYPANVKTDEEYQVEMRRDVVTFSGPSWTIHAGRQQVVWGDSVGIFIADVVNPKDYRQFLVLDMDDIRIPLGALDAQRTWEKRGRWNCSGLPMFRRAGCLLLDRSLHFLRRPLACPPKPRGSNLRARSVRAAWECAIPG
jgi:hypothetical protein